MSDVSANADKIVDDYFARSRDKKKGETIKKWVLEAIERDNQGVVLPGRYDPLTRQWIVDESPHAQERAAVVSRLLGLPGHVQIGVDPV